jgi:hypothetical protein
MSTGGKRQAPGPVGECLDWMKKASLVMVGILILALSTPGFDGARRAAAKERGAAVDTMTTANGFRPLPDTITIRVRLVPQRDHRYGTEGDWPWNGNIARGLLASPCGRYTARVARTAPSSSGHLQGA